MRRFISVFKPVLIPAAAITLLAATSIVSAEQSAHVHGLAEFTLAAEGDVIQMRLASPAMNILGFEHEPRNKEQTKILEHALKKLNKPESLISFKGGQCRFTSVELDNPFEAHEDHDKHDHDEHKHAEHEATEHREFVVEYQAQCKKMNELKAINFTLLTEFKSIEKLDVQYILSGKQGGVTLNSKASRLSINE
jgi:hypothetical protein